MINYDKVKYKMSSIADLIPIIDKDKPLMFDTETIGFYGRIRLAQFFQKGWEKAILVEWPSPYELVSLLTKVHCVMHNSHYDITTIQQQLGKQYWAPEKFSDTFLLARLHFFLKESFSLDAVVKYVTGENPYEGNDQQKSDWAVPVLSEEQKIYAAVDVIYLQDVYDIVYAAEEDYNYRLDMLCVGYCLEFQWNGAPVDRTKLDKRFEENALRVKEIALPINCNSYQQVRTYIGSQLSDDEGLARLSMQGNERAKNVRESRKLIKNSSFLTKFNNAMDDVDEFFGVIHGKFKCSARSGRTTSDDQNLQQIPRSLKGIFGIEEDGEEVIIFSDFAQIQLRAVCVKTGDTTMERLFREGADLHNFVAKMIFGENFTDEQRQISKTANFGLLFGAGANTFISILIKQANLWLTEEEASKIIKKWLGLWTEIDKWQKQGIKDWKKGIPWETPLGRRYVAKMMTDQLAMQIQGFEAEVAKLAMHYMLPKLRELHPSIKLRIFCHDSYMFTGINDPAIYNEACKIIASSMQEAWIQMCQDVAIKDLPMPVKVRIGFNWGDIEKGKFVHEYLQ